MSISMVESPGTSFIVPSPSSFIDEKMLESLFSVDLIGVEVIGVPDPDAAC